MKIQWIGHSCFVIEDSSGRRILTDPFHHTVGYTPYKNAVNTVTVSHQHFDHNNIENYKDNSIIIDKYGYYDLGFARIHGFPSYHDSSKGGKRGPNTIFIYELDNLRLCHLGDLGHQLDSDYLNKLGNIDVLFIPVGGHFTLTGKDAYKLCRLIKSRLVFPMHYNTISNSMLLDGPEEFIINMKNVEKIDNSIYFLPSTINSINKVILLKPDKNSFNYEG
ncbi:MBL fold metallo-hydrolase [Clostridium polynesiense]|uniref:MBL fold metallo-hydrolase n=1 Tax=Clostridium polynesiense TaxID=1325933 RepID=UPI00058D1226|nr:MBL fold metallo-hydrolase [Clostridium polynesiense]